MRNFRGIKKRFFVPRKFRVKSESEQATLAFLVAKISGCYHLAEGTATSY